MHSFNIQDDRSTCFPSTTNFKNAGVSIKIEVASRFKYSNRLYQRGAGSLIFPRASGGMLPQKIIKFQSTSRRSLAFRGPEWVQRSMFSIQENLAKTSSRISFDLSATCTINSYKQWTNDNYQVTYICTWTNSVFVMRKQSGRLFWAKVADASRRSSMLTETPENDNIKRFCIETSPLRTGLFSHVILLLCSMQGNNGLWAKTLKKILF